MHVLNSKQISLVVGGKGSKGGATGGAGGSGGPKGSPGAAGSAGSGSTSTAGGSSAVLVNAQIAVEICGKGKVAEVSTEGFKCK